MLSVVCPFCESKAGERCTDPSSRAGGPRGSNAAMHVARIKRAGRVAIKACIANGWGGKGETIAARIVDRVGLCACGSEWSKHKYGRNGANTTLECP